MATELDRAPHTGSAIAPDGPARLSELILNLKDRDGSALREAVERLGDRMRVPDAVLADPSQLRAYAGSVAEQTPVFIEYLMGIVRQIAAAPDIETSEHFTPTEIGLNSLDMAAIITMVEAQIGVEIPLVEFADDRTIADLAVHLAHTVALAERT